MGRILLMTMAIAIETIQIQAQGQHIIKTQNIRPQNQQILILPPVVLRVMVKGRKAKEECQQEKEQVQLWQD